MALSSDILLTKEVEFLEDYVLAVDRLKVVADLYDQDTMDYWYWSLLNAQVRGNANELDQWLDNCAQTEFVETVKMQELFFRQALIDYGQDNAEQVNTKLEEICENVNLNHEQDRSFEKKKREDYPTQLPLSTKEILRKEWNKLMEEDGSLFDIFTPRAADFIAKQELEPQDREDFLELVQDESADITNLLTIIKEDLMGGTIFGERQIHEKLTRFHMEKLAQRMPEILGDETFLIAFCRRLRPITDSHISDNVSLLGEYLDGLKAFAFDLIVDNHASLKALILFNYLKFQESQGLEYSRRVVQEYMAIPKCRNIFKPNNSVADNNPQVAADPYWSTEDLPELKQIGDDEALLRRALANFFLAGDKTDPWSPYADKDLYALPLFAEAKLLEGTGNEAFTKAQKHTIEKSEVIPGAYKRLVERVELELTARNKQYYAVEDEVTLEFITKNNPTIEVNIYAVNAKNYYKQMKNEIPLDLNLSGSSPIDSFNVNFDNPPIIRVNQEQRLEVLDGLRGVFIVDLIGNGVTCRALIRKGELRYICDQCTDSTKGYVFKVFNEYNELIDNPKIWMAGTHYLGDENGDVIIPFATEITKKNQLIVLEDLNDGGSATLQRFSQEKPEYILQAGMYIDREQMMKKQEAVVVVRANLYMNNRNISLANLTDVQFKLTMEDNVGDVRTRIEIIKLSDQQETLFNFTVPAELRSVTCVLTCKCNGERLMAKQVIGINSTEDTMAIANMFMFPSGNAGYVLAVLGKNGEGYADIPVKLSFTHRYLKNPYVKMVQTDVNGHVYLGRLPDVHVVDAICTEDFVNGESSFEVLTNFCTVPQTIHQKTGTLVRLPFTPQDDEKAPDFFLYDNCYIRSFSELASYANGYITIDGLPAGDFTLYIRDSTSIKVTIRISEGLCLKNQERDYVISRNRVLELSEEHPLQIVNTSGNREDGYTINLEGYNDKTRVHVICCSQNPVFNVYGFLSSSIAPPNIMEFSSPASRYLTAAPLSEEYNYIAQRKHANTYVGNLLQTPQILANAYTSRELPARNADPQKYIPRELETGGMTVMEPIVLIDSGKAQKRRESDPAAIEYLGEPSFVYANKMVDENGAVVLGPQLISPQHNILQIIAVDDDNTCLKNIILPEITEDVEIKQTDVRLVESLNATAHFTEVRQVICLRNKSDDYVIADFSTAEYEPYESLMEPYNLYRSFAVDMGDKVKNAFGDFEALMTWNTLSQEEQLALYDKIACNETNYFMYRKFPGFFEEVVLPAIANKAQKTFFDKYLLGQDLNEYTQAHCFHQLNALEQILLAERLGDEAWTQRTLRTFKEKSQLEPINPKEQDKIFDLAINSRQLGVEELDRMLELLEAQVAEKFYARERDQIQKAMDQSMVTFGNNKHTKVKGSEVYIDSTREFQETGYYKLPITSEHKDLITHTRFWNDYAQFLLDPNHHTDGFLSEWFMVANSNLSELLMGLAVLDVPLEADEPRRLYLEGNEVRVLAKDPAILFVRELVQTEVRTSAISVSTNYFDPMEKTHLVDGERIDRFIDGEFSTNKVYGSRIVVTNVSSVEQNVELLCQVPQGSIQCGQECFQTKSWNQVVESFGTFKREYYFYWPEPGTFVHYPVHVNKNGETIGHGKDVAHLNVETALQPSDITSWRYISNLGEEVAVLEFLAESPQALSVDLSKICWRFHDNPDFYDQVCDILRRRHIYNDSIWAYSIILDDGRGTPTLGEFLAQNSYFVNHAGPHLDCKLVTLDSSAVRDYQINEFWPLKNPRAHDVINNCESFKDYYSHFLYKLAFQTHSVENITIEDKLCFVNYLLLRGKIDKATELFQLIDPEAAVQESKLSYDYLSVYLAFHDGNPDDFVKMAEEYTNSPLPKSHKERWQNVLHQIEHRKDPQLSDEMFLKKQQEARRKAARPFLDFDPQEDHTMVIVHRNIPDLLINFYRTELELMFSMHPFQDENVSYRLMMPNMSETIHLVEQGEIISGETVIALPEVLRGENTIIEMIAGDQIVTKVNYDNEIEVQISTETGLLRVLHSKQMKPIPKAYCKVMAQRVTDGKPVFYKDGYTDIRGVFDYRFLSTDQIRSSKRLAILISTEDCGSVIKEVKIADPYRTRHDLFSN